MSSKEEAFENMEISSKLCSRSRTTRFFSESERFKMAKKDRTFNNFRHDISAILRPRNFVQCTVARSEAILDPQVRHRQMADPAQTPASADSNCCSGVRRDLQSHIEAKVRATCLETK